MKKIMQSGIPGFLTLGMVVVLCAPALADENKLEDASEKATESAETLREMMASDDQAIPDWLLERAEGIAVIPNTIKAGLGIGGRGGQGLISKRQGSEWTAPMFINFGGASIGLQAGVESADLVLVFTDKKGLDALVKDKVKLGADASVTAGPVGRSAEIGTNATMDTAIYSYSRSKGLFAGVALDGAVLEIDDSENQKVYGKEVDAKAVLAGKSELATPPVLQPFTTALRETVSAAKVDTKAETKAEMK